MIAKSVSRKTKDSFARLGKYVGNEAKQSVEVEGWGRLASYAADSSHDGAKVADDGIRFTNMAGVTTMADAILLVEATQGAALPSKADRNYHLVISFPPGERPQKEQLQDIEDTLVKAIGLEDHQRLSAIHDDQDHLHIHVAINKVHPDSRRVITPHYDKKSLMAACARLEVKHNLTRTHAPKVTMPDGTVVRGGAADKEAHGGEKSLLRWVRDNAKDALINAASWPEIHEAAGQFDLLIKKHGAGLVVCTKTNPALAIKASDIDRSLSIKRLQDRLGAYLPSENIELVNDTDATAPHVDDADIQTVQAGEGAGAAEDSPDGVKPASPKKKYGPEPIKRSPEAEALWAAYLVEKEEAPRRREEALKNVRDSHEAVRASAQEALRGHRENARMRHYTPQEKQARINAEKERISQSKEKAARERDEVRKANKTPNWYDYLISEVEEGNEEALKILRQVEKRRDAFARNILRAEDWSAGKDIVLKNVQKYVRKDGTIIYQTEDGGKVDDRAKEITVNELSAGSAALALILASERFDRPLKVDGTEEFKDALAQAASLPGTRVRFADADMEARRVAAAARRVAEEQRFSQTATYLVVPPSERNEVKERGARWDAAKKRWFVPPRVDLEPFKAWNLAKKDADPAGPGTALIVPKEHRDFVRDAGAQFDPALKVWIVPAGVDPEAMGLAQFVDGNGRFSNQKVHLNVPYSERDEAKELGARWDSVSKSWYVPPRVDQAGFAKWLDSENKDADLLRDFVSQRNSIAESRYPIKQHRTLADGETVKGSFVEMAIMSNRQTVILIETDTEIVIAPVNAARMENPSSAKPGEVIELKDNAVRAGRSGARR